MSLYECLCLAIESILSAGGGERYGDNADYQHVATGSQHEDHVPESCLVSIRVENQHCRTMLLSFTR